MRTYYYSLLLLVFGATYSLFNPGGSSGSAQTSEAGKGSQSTPVADSGTGADKGTNRQDENTYPEDLCRQFADCEPVPGKNSLRPKSLRDDIKEEPPQFIIATVPDPTTTHLRVEFDRAVDGIKDAAADEGFLFRRYWFPWPLEPTRQFSNQADQDKEDEESAFKRQHPGFLLFENIAHQPLIVLLVGESPTDGIHRGQFRRAIKLKHEIEKYGVPSRDPFYILGTSFSGSLYTLELALENEDTTHGFDAVSGTVSDRESIQAFNARNTCEKCSLRTLKHDSKTVLTAFLQYLQTTWYYDNSRKVAILSETDTVFGSLQDLDDKHFFRIPFPRDIAHLRNAYQSYPELSGFGPTNPDLQQRKNLPLPLDDTRNTIDSIPDFAAQTVVSQETMVSQIANRIRHERIEFAGVIGTDILDVLFISRFVRAASPDTRLFLLDPDLLFVHAADALPFEGVLAVTTYPLLDGNPPFEPTQMPDEKQDEKHRIFSSPFQQGTHNAMRVLMADMGHKEVPPLAGYDFLEKNDKSPAVWITSVGRESFVPVAVLGDADMRPPNEPALVARPALVAGAKTPELRSREPHDPPRIWWILLLTVTLAMAGLALVFQRAQKSPATSLSDFRVQGGEGNKQHLSLLLVFATGIYLVVASTGKPVLAHPVAHSLRFLCAAACLAAGLTAIGSLACIRQRQIKLKISSSLVIGVVAAGVAAVVVLFVFLSNDPRHLNGAFFTFRSFEVSAGAAPAIPFLFLLGGFLVFSFVSLQRCVFHHQRIQAIPQAKCDGVLGGNVWPAARRLRRQLYEPFQGSPKPEVLLAPAAFTLCLVGLRASHIRSFEGVCYDWLFTLWASALAAALVVVCGHFLRSWRLLNRILDQLEMHPLRRALSALPADQSGSPIWQSNPRKRSYQIGTRAMDALAALRAGDHCPPELTTLIDTAAKHVDAILKKVARGERETPREYLAAQRALAETADNLLGELQRVWKQGSSEIIDNSKDTGTKHEDELPPLIYAFEFVALRYLAFIHYAMLQLRNMLTFLSLGFLAFAFALMSYPFQGERLIAWLITLLFVTLASGVGLVFAQMSTNAALSRITNRDAGTLGLHFFHRALAFGALPLLTVLASNFNGVARLLFSWIEPALKTLH
jgi:hypothetical protein